jgi:hypothetical protein
MRKEQQQEVEKRLEMGWRADKYHLCSGSHWSSASYLILDSSLMRHNISEMESRFTKVHGAPDIMKQVQ